MNYRRACRVVVVVLLMLLSAGCMQLRDFFGPSTPSEWAALLKDIRAFEHRIGFIDTDNFAGLSTEQHAFPICGYASRLTLPYSYQDPAIQWPKVETEEECLKHGGDADAYFGRVEAWGEVGTPVNPVMLTGKLDRFVYLVIHEDCHDQFDLPLGIEEALCDVITHKGMAVFAGEEYGPYSREGWAIRNYAETQSGVARAVIAYYEQLDALYARYQRNEISRDVLMQGRSAIFMNAKTPLGWTKGEINNVRIANYMTYSRHYPFLESVFVALGGDLARTVALFRQVDNIKPTSAAVMRQSGISREGSVEYLRADEAAVMETISKVLADTTTAQAPGRTAFPRL